MAKPTRFDVLIVYNGTSAKSASNRAKTNTTPFPLTSKNASCNLAYSYFLESCAAQGLKAAFSTSNDIMGAGSCASFWSYKNKQWHKSNKTCYSTTIFDKFSPRSASNKVLHKLLFSKSDIKPFNNPSLRRLFGDKQKTYNILATHAIPTISLLGDTVANINQACARLSTTMSSHGNNSDFSSDIIMKDRYGAGGYHIYKFAPNQAREMHAVTALNPDISFVLQPFANPTIPRDIRLIYLGGEIIESYIRVAKGGDFRCNEHQGGSLSYLPIKDISSTILAKAQAINDKLGSQSSLYSLDFMVSDEGNPYLLEGNVGPGLDWNLSVKKEEVNAKKFIRSIVNEISKRVSNLPHHDRKLLEIPSPHNHFRP